MTWRLCCDGDEFDLIMALWNDNNNLIIPQFDSPVSKYGVGINCWKDDHNKNESMTYYYSYSLKTLNLLACMSASSWGRYFSYNFPD